MKNFTLLILILFFASCKEQIKSKTEVTVNLQQPNVDFNSLELDFDKWWTYHNDNISLSSEFIALNNKSERISKNDFLEKLTTGDYIPLKIVSPDTLLKYKLFKLDSSAQKSIRPTIKSTSAVVYKYFKLEGTSFPKFSFTDLKGKKYNNENTTGKTLILKCWFINCKPCIAEFPELNQLVEEHDNKKDILFVSLAIDSKADLDKFFIKKAFKYETIPNQKEFMEKTLDVQQYPTHLIIDKNGIIEKVVSKSSELISYLKEGKISHSKGSGNFAPPPPPGPAQ